MYTSHTSSHRNLWVARMCRACETCRRSRPYGRPHRSSRPRRRQSGRRFRDGGGQRAPPEGITIGITPVARRCAKSLRAQQGPVVAEIRVEDSDVEASRPGEKTREKTFTGSTQPVHDNITRRMAYSATRALRNIENISQLPGVMLSTRGRGTKATTGTPRS